MSSSFVVTRAFSDQINIFGAPPTLIGLREKTIIYEIYVGSPVKSAEVGSTAFLARE